MSQVPSQGFITVTVPANQPANSTLQATITIDPREGAFTFQQVPITEAWVIEDIFVTASPAIDLNLEIIKNRTKKLVTIGPVSTRLVSNPSRPPSPVIVFGPGEIMSVQAINLAAGGASATTVTVYFIFRRFVS